MQDSRARNARNGFEGAIIEKISDFFPKNYRSFRGGGGGSVQDSRGGKARKGFEGPIIEKNSDFFANKFYIFQARNSKLKFQIQHHQNLKFEI